MTFALELLDLITKFCQFKSSLKLNVCHYKGLLIEGMIGETTICECLGSPKLQKRTVSHFI